MPVCSDEHLNAHWVLNDDELGLLKGKSGRALRSVGRAVEVARQTGSHLLVQLKTNQPELYERVLAMTETGMLIDQILTRDLARNRHMTAGIPRPSVSVILSPELSGQPIFNA